MELVAFRFGTAWLAKNGIHDMPGHTDATYNAVGHDAPADHPARDVINSESSPAGAAFLEKKQDIDPESGFNDASEETPAAAQILGVAILEFGVVFHSVRLSLYQDCTVSVPQLT